MIQDINQLLNNRGWQDMLPKGRVILYGASHALLRHISKS